MNSNDTTTSAGARGRQGEAPLLDGEHVEGALPCDKETGSQLLNDLEERRVAREHVLEKRGKHIRDHYW